MSEVKRVELSVFQVTACDLMALTSDRPFGIVVVTPPLETLRLVSLEQATANQRVLWGRIAKNNMLPSLFVQLIGPVAHGTYCHALQPGLGSRRSGWFSKECVQSGEAEAILDTHWRIIGWSLIHPRHRETTADGIL